MRKIERVEYSKLPVIENELYIQINNLKYLKDKLVEGLEKGMEISIHALKYDECLKRMRYLEKQLNENR